MTKEQRAKEDTAIIDHIHDLADEWYAFEKAARSFKYVRLVDPVPAHIYRYKDPDACRFFTCWLN